MMSLHPSSSPFMEAHPVAESAPRSGCAHAGARLLLTRSQVVAPMRAEDILALAAVGCARRHAALVAEKFLTRVRVIVSSAVWRVRTYEELVERGAAAAPRQMLWHYN